MLGFKFAILVFPVYFLFYVISASSLLMFSGVLLHFFNILFVLSKMVLTIYICIYHLSVVALGITVHVPILSQSISINVLLLKWGIETLPPFVSFIHHLIWLIGNEGTVRLTDSSAASLMMLLTCLHSVCSFGPGSRRGGTSGTLRFPGLALVEVGFTCL